MFWNKHRAQPLASGRSAAMEAELSVLRNHTPPPELPKTLITHDLGELPSVSPTTIRELEAPGGMFTIAHHIENITRILETLDTRKGSLLETMRIDREDFEAREADHQSQVAEIDRLAATYEAALLTAKADGPVIAGDLGGLGRHEQSLTLISEVLSQIHDPNSEWRKAHPDVIVSGGDKLSREEIARLPLSPSDKQIALDEFDAANGEEMGAIPRPPKPRRRRPANKFPPTE